MYATVTRRNTGSPGGDRRWISRDRSEASIRGIDQKQWVSPVDLHPASVGSILKHWVVRVCRKGINSFKVKNIAGHNTASMGLRELRRMGPGIRDLPRRGTTVVKSFHRYIRLGR